METGGVIQLFLALGVIIAAAQFAGAAARRLGQPRVFGELLAGVVLGPTALNMLQWGTFSDPDALYHTIHELAELGVLFLMFSVGLEVHLHELLSVGKVAVWGGLLGAVFPLVLAFPVMLPFGYDTEAAIFVGVVLAATSVSISAQTLLELGLLSTREGIGLLAAAVVDDVLAILFLSIVIAVLGGSGGGSAGDIVWILVRIILYIVGAMAVAWFVLPRLFDWFDRLPELTNNVAAFALVMALVFGWSAEALGGVATITGSFIAGLGLSQTSERTKNEIVEAVRRVSYSFLVPVFFVSVGLQTDLTAIESRLLPLAGVMLIAAVVAKVAGSGLGAYIGGFNRGESVRLGICMISRGEVGLIIASLGLTSGLLSNELFQPVFLVILLTTVLTPPLVRYAFRTKMAEQEILVAAEQVQSHSD
ncbi:MAG: cation:proton antiporter [Chloroflexi bacterium]|nr:cation:proton antiporter [Chloroflexota bacterium]